MFQQYTTQEEQIILECVKECPANIKAGLEVAATKLPNRSLSSVTNRYYNKLRVINTPIAVASSNGKVALGKNAPRKRVVPNAQTVADAMLHAAFSTLSKEQAIKFLISSLSTEDKLSLLNRVTSRINERD